MTSALGFRKQKEGIECMSSLAITELYAVPSSDFVTGLPQLCDSIAIQCTVLNRMHASHPGLFACTARSQ